MNLVGSVTQRRPFMSSTKGLIVEQLKNPISNKTVGLRNYVSSYYAYIRNLFCVWNDYYFLPGSLETKSNKIVYEFDTNLNLWY